MSDSLPLGRPPRGGGPGSGILGAPVLGDPGPRPPDLEFDRFAEEGFRIGLYVLDLSYRPEVDPPAPVSADVRRRRILGADRIFGAPEGFAGATAPVERMSFASAPYISPAGARRRPNTAIAARISDVQITRSAPVGPAASNRVIGTQAAITLNNAGGALDWLPAGNSVRGLEQTLWYGPRRRDFEQFQRRFVGTGLGFKGVGEAFRIEMQEDDPALTAFLSPGRFRGDGSPLGGDSELRGTIIPTALGNVWNAPAIRLSARDEIWFRAQGPITNVAVKSKGLPHPVIGDVDRTEDLRNVPLQSDEVATCDREGTLRFGSPPVGPVTCDFLGLVFDDEPLRTLRDFALWVFRQRMKLPMTDIDTASLSALPVFEANWYSGTEEWRARDLLNAIAYSAGGWFDRGLDGRWRFGRLVAPEQLSATRPIVVPSRQLQPEPLDLPILSEQAIEFRRNWAGPMRDEDIGDAVPAAERSLLQRQASVQTAGGLAEAQSYRDAAPGVPIASLFTGPECIAVARDQIALYGRERAGVRIPTGRRGYRLDLGDAASFVSPRFGVAQNPGIVLELGETGSGRSVEALVMVPAADVTKGRLR